MTRWTFSLTTDSARDVLDAALPGGLRLGETAEERLRRTWVDTFDWELHSAGLCAYFVKTGRRRWELTLRDHDGSESAALLDAAPGLARDLPPGPVRDRVAPVIGIRRLLPQVTVSTRRTVAPLLDDLDKTLGRVLVEKRTAFAPSSRRPLAMDDRVVLTALRGFDREVRTAARALVSAGALTKSGRSERDAALTAIGRAAGDYTSKLRFDLTAKMPATEAVADIFEHLLDTMRVNEPGLVARLDEEFLHDYRVAVRRTRSALSHFGGVLTPRALAWGTRFFADLGRRTGAARDLDVLLLELPGYANRLPEERAAGLDAMRARLAADRTTEYADFARWLATKTYARGVERWRREIEGLRAAEDGPSIGALAAGAIQATAAKVFKQAKKIRRTDDDEPVHRLRIRCKKLRYVLEFSRTLTPGGEVAELIAALKRLQDVLGTFNDVVVHAPRLTATASREPSDPALALATGWLLAELERRHREVRAQVDSTVRRFRREAPEKLETLLAHLPEPPARSR